MTVTTEAARDGAAQWHVPVWTLGERLRKAREDAGLEQARMAAELGVNRRSVGNWECGHIVPRRSTLMAWALRTGVPVWWLEGAEEPRPDNPVGAHRLPRLDLNQRPSGLRKSQARHVSAARAASHRRPSDVALRTIGGAA